MGNNLNRIEMIGNIGTDPEFKYFESGAMKTKFTLAVNRYDHKEKKEVTDWFDVETFSKLAEFLKKGIKVCVAGKLITSVWKNKEDKYMKNYIIVADHLEILTPKEKDETAEQAQSQPQAQTQAQTQAPVQETYEQQELIEDDEIPF